jgi:hypothetical protein
MTVEQLGAEIGPFVLAKNEPMAVKPAGWDSGEEVVRAIRPADADSVRPKKTEVVVHDKDVIET